MIVPLMEGKVNRGGRLRHQTAMSIPTLSVRVGRAITGCGVTPQDGHALLDHAAATTLQSSV